MKIAWAARLAIEFGTFGSATENQLVAIDGPAAAVAVEVIAVS